MKKILSMILCVAMMATLIAGSIVTVSAEVTADMSWYDAGATEYHLDTPAEFLGFVSSIGTKINGATKDEMYAGKTIYLDADIDMTGVTYPEMGLKNFAGAIDGQGHTISNISATASSSDNATRKYGLFGLAKYVAPAEGSEYVPVTVKDLAIVNSQITFADDDANMRKNNIGVIFGCTDGTVEVLLENLYVDVDINYNKTATGNKIIGGLVGGLETNGVLTIKSCVYAGTINTPNGNVTWVGGLLGQANAQVTIENSAFYGTITHAKEKVGGLIGNPNTNAYIIIRNSIVYGNGLKKSGGSCAAFVGGSTGGQLMQNLICDAANSHMLVTSTTATHVTNQDTLYDVSAETMIGIAAKKTLTEKGMTGWTATATGYPMPTALAEYGFTPEIAADADAKTTLVGYQATAENNNKFNLRLVSVIDVAETEALSDYDAVGFRVVASYANGETAVVLTKDYSTTKVYKAITGNEEDTDNATTNYTAEALGGDAIFVLPCENIPANMGEITFVVTTYFVQGDATVEGATEVFQVNPETDIPETDLLEEAA